MSRDINTNLNLIKDTIPTCFIDRVLELKENVINNKLIFSENDLNNWYNEILIYINKS